MTIAIAGIASVTVIIVALIMSAGYIATHSKEVKNGYQPKEAKPLKITDRDVLYLCDKSKCPDAHQCGECIHTTDVEHAANFRKEMWGSSCVYVEQSKDERVL